MGALGRKRICKNDDSLLRDLRTAAPFFSKRMDTPAEGDQKVQKPNRRVLIRSEITSRRIMLSR